METQQALYQRIKIIYEDTGLSMDKFVKPFGFKSANMYAIMAGRVESIGTQVIETLCTHYKVNPIWLIEGTGERYKTELKQKVELWEPDHIGRDAKLAKLDSIERTVVNLLTELNDLRKKSEGSDSPRYKKAS